MAKYMVKLLLLTLFMMSASYAQLVAEYKFEDASGNPSLIDSSGNGHDGNLIQVDPNNPTVSLEKNGKYFYAMNKTNKDESAFVISNDSQLQINGDFTFSAWIYIDSDNGDYANFVAKTYYDGNSHDTEYWVGMDNGKLLYFHMDTSNTGHYFSSNSQLPKGRWVHVAVVRNHSASTKTVKIYIDGELDKSETYTGDILTTDKNVSLGLCKPCGSSSYSLKGRMDCVKIYNEARSVDEIKQDMQSCVEVRPFTCDGTPYTVIDQPSMMQYVDRDDYSEHNISVVKDENGTEIYINGIAYNILDDYIYAIDADDTDNGHLGEMVRVGSDQYVTYLGIPQPSDGNSGTWDVGSKTPYSYIGTMDSNGTFYGLGKKGSGSNTKYYLYIVKIGTKPTPGSLKFTRVQLDPSPHYNIPADLTFNVRNGRLYGVARKKVNGTFKHYLYEIDIENKKVKEITVNPKNPDESEDKLPSSAGGAWSTSKGELYFYSNNDGNLTKIEMLSDGTATVDYIGPVTPNGKFDATACRPPFITKKASDYRLSPGEEFTYTFTIYNPFTKPIDVNFSDAAPEGISFVTGTVSPSSPGGGTVTVDNGSELNISGITLPINGSVEFNVTARISESITSETNISNVAYISYGTNVRGSDDPTTSEIDDNTTVQVLPRLVVSDANATEGDALIFDVNLSFAVGENVELNLTLSDGTATGGSDYNATTMQYKTQNGTWTDLSNGGTVSIPAGETNLQVRVLTIDDNDEEGDENLTLLALVRSDNTSNDSDEGVGTIEDNDGNRPPVANDDSATTLEDHNVTIDVENNDTDPENDLNLSSVEVTSGPDHGTVSVDTTTGKITYDPDSNWNGTDRFTYRICDNGTPVLCDEANVTVTVTPVNDAPVVVEQIPDQENNDSDSGISLNAGSHFSDPDGDDLRYSASNLPGGLSIDPDTGVISGTLDHNASQGGNDGVYSVTVTATDPEGASVEATFTWTVNNVPPIAQNDTNTTQEDTTLSVAAPGVLGNDNDPDGDEINVISFTDNVSVKNAGETLVMNEGNLTIEADGSYTFVPAPDFNGDVPPVTYTTSDNEGGTATAELNITVIPVNDAPVVVEPIPDQENNDSDVVELNVSEYFSDSDSADLNYSAGGLPGGLSIDTDTGVISGTLDHNASQGGNDGNYSVTITVTDGEASVTTTFIWIVKDPVPTATDDLFTGNEDEAIEGNVVGADNGYGVDSDPDGDDLNVSGFTVDGTRYEVNATAQLPEGNLTIRSDGNLTFVPRPNYNGTLPEVIEYTLSDGEGGEDNATVTITIDPVNDAPVAEDDSQATPKNRPVAVPVLVNDYDVDDDNLTITDVNTTDTNGTVQWDANGTLIFIPDIDFIGTTRFSYTICDDGDPILCDEANVTITVTDPEDNTSNSVTAIADSATVENNATVRIPVLVNDYDNQYDSFSVTGTTDPVHGTATLNSDGTVTYDPDDGFIGDDTFTYTITDARGATDTAIVTVRVSAAGEPLPAAVADAAMTGQEINVTVPVLLNDTEGTQITAVTDPANGTVTVNPDGTITYDPEPGFSGHDTFSYTIVDENGKRATAVVTVTVVPAPDVIISDANATEGVDDALHFDVNLSNPYVTDINLTLRPVDVNATTGEDYNGSEIRVTIPAGSTGVQVSVPVYDDATYELTEEMNLTVASVDAGVVGEHNDTGTGTIYDNDPEPTVTVGDVNVTEGGDLVFEVNLSNASYEDINLSLLTSEGTATAGSDYNATPVPTQVTIPAGETNVTIVVHTLEDTIDEPDETMVLEANVTAGTTANESAQGTGTILDNDEAPDLTIGDASVTEGGTLTFDINLSNPSSEEINVTLSFEGDTATADEDYNGSSVTVTIPAGQTHATVSVATYQDTIYEGDENLTAVVESTSGGAVGDTGDTGTGTIVDDDPQPTVESVGNASATEGEDLIHAVHLSNPSASDMNYSFSVTGDTATPDVDYNATDFGFSSGVSYDAASGTLTVPAGVTDFNVTVHSIEDALDENNETYSVTVGGKSGTGTIIDDDTTPVAVDDNATTAEDTPLSVAAPGVLGNDSDADGDSLQVVAFEVNASTYEPNATAELEEGNLSLNSDGSFTFIPAPDYNGPVPVVTYTVSDGENNTTALLKITVTPVNDLPVARDDNATTEEDQEVVIPVDANDSDVDGDELNVTSVTQPENGRVTIDPDTNEITYRPDPDFNGVDRFSYTICQENNASACAEANVTVTVTPVNDAPVAEDDSAATPMDTPVAVPVLVNDHDVDDTNLTLTEVNTSATAGSVDWDANGTVIFTPEPGFVGTTRFSYTVCDNGDPALCDEANVTITVVGEENNSVTAVADAVSTLMETEVNIPVSANDYDSEGDEFNITAVGDPAHGSVTIEDDGTITYVPDEGFMGEDTFTYTITDTGGATDTAIVVVHVLKNEESLLIANGDGATTDQDLNVTIPVLENDEHPNGDVQITEITDPANGSVVVNEDGTLTYIPDPGFSGHDTFVYTIMDENGNVARAAVTVTVRPAPDVIISDANATEGEGNLSFDVNLSHPYGADINLTLRPGDINATAGEDYDGAEINVTIPAGSSGVRVVIPVLDDDVYETTEEMNLSVAAVSAGSVGDTDDSGIGTIYDNDPEPTVLISDANATEGDDLVFDVNLSNPSYEAITLILTTRDGSAEAETDYNETSVTVTIPAGATGVTVTVPTVADGLVEENETMELYVSEVVAGTVDPDMQPGIGTILNDDTGPVAGNDNADISGEHGAQTVDVLHNDESGNHADLNASTVSLVGGEDTDGDGYNDRLVVDGEGVWSVNDDGTITFTPEEGYIGDPAPIEYTVEDDAGNTTGAEVALNYPPLAVDDNATGTPGETVMVDILANDRNTSQPIDPESVSLVAPGSGWSCSTDNEGDTVTCSDDAGEIGEWTVDEANGSITFVPADGFAGCAEINYTVAEEGDNGERGPRSNEATVRVCYPALVDDIKEADTWDSPVTVDVLDNDAAGIDPATVRLVDPESGDPVTELIVPGEGTWTVDPDNGAITFTPEDGFVGDPTPVQYVAEYNGETTEPATVTIHYPLRANDDEAHGAGGDPVSVDLLANDNGDLNRSSVELNASCIDGAVGEDSDGDGDIDRVTVPDQGVWSVDANGTLTFTPEDGFIGQPDDICYRVKDTDGALSNPARVTVTFREPVAEDDDYTVRDGNGVIIDPRDDNDQPGNGDLEDHQIEIVTQPEHGTVTVLDDGRIKYVPEPDYVGTDSFEYRIVDPAGYSDTAVVTLEVNCASSQPSDGGGGGGDALGFLGLLLMLLMTAGIGYTFVRIEEKRGRIQ